MLLPEELVNIIALSLSKQDTLNLLRTNKRYYAYIYPIYYGNFTFRLSDTIINKIFIVNKDVIPTEAYNYITILEGVDCVDTLYKFRNVKKIKFTNNFNEHVDNLPSTVTHIVFGDLFNQLVDNLPPSVTHITFGICFYNSVDNLPPNLTHLTFKNLNNRLIMGNLPNTVTHLVINSRLHYSMNITHLPKKLKMLQVNKKTYDMQKLRYQL